MNDSWVLWRTGFARIADAAATAGCLWLGWQVMFGDFQPFHVEALWIGMIGALACLADPRARRSFPAGLVGYALAGVVSSLVHNWAGANLDGGFAWPVVFGPVDYLLYMLVFVFGAAYVLRTPARQAWFVTALTIAVLVIAAQLLFDRASTDFVYSRNGRTFIPSVAQWSGLHQVGLVFVIGIPLCLSLAIRGGTVMRAVSGGLLTTFLAIAAWFNGSRSGLMVIAFIVTVMLATRLPRPRLTGRQLMTVAGLAIVLVGAAAMWSPWSLSDRLFDRAPIWRAAWQMFLDHPWTGVGPRQFTNTMHAGGYGATFLPWYESSHGGTENAHNLPLQVAAETGIVGLVSLVWFAVWAWRGCARSAARNHELVIATAVGFAVMAFFARTLFDNFFALDFETDRIKPLAWSLFAAAVAVHRWTPERKADR